MKVSGFTFIRNGVKFQYPFKESILSILPICDEFIINYGESEDSTLQKLQELKNKFPKKIKIIKSKWDENLREGGKILAQQTNIALSHCLGDWCFYLQADEVVHEKYLDYIYENMLKYLHDNSIEGFLFNYLHFYLSFKTYFDKRPFYRREIRIIRNGIGVTSYKDAQGFRINNRKLKVKLLNAYIYHYGWVRPENVMKSKQMNLDKYWHNDNWIKEEYSKNKKIFKHLEGLKFFTESHPKVMNNIIKKAKWQIIPDKNDVKIKSPFKRFLNFIEDKILRTQIGEYRNYKIVKK